MWFLTVPGEESINNACAPVLGYKQECPSLISLIDVAFVSPAKQTVEILSLFLFLGLCCILAFKDADIPELDISSVWQLLL